MSISYTLARQGRAGQGRAGFMNELNLVPKTFPPVFNPQVQTAESVPACKIVLHDQSGFGKQSEG
jgi:hypothetical protein